MSKQTELIMYKRGFLDACSMFEQADGDVSNVEIAALKYISSIVEVPDEKTAKTQRPRKARKPKNIPVQTVRQAVPTGADRAGKDAS